jgi:hypothetical protein
VVDKGSACKFSNKLKIDLFFPPRLVQVRLESEMYPMFSYSAKYPCEVEMEIFLDVCN